MILDSDNTRQRVLEKFLNICQLEGWNDEALHQAVMACDIDNKFSNIIFENGCLDVAKFHIKLQNEKCAKLVLASDDFVNKKIREKITLFLKQRFAVEKEHHLAIKRLANFYTNPKNFTKLEIGARPLFQGLQSCFIVADCAWKTINDQSTDFNYYTKRLTLAKIVLRCFLTFICDDSDDLAKTNQVIDSEIAKVMEFEKRKSQIKKVAAKSTQHFRNFVHDENGQLKSPKALLQSLPFIRLIKK